MPVVDLRSDTMTYPNADMRRAMAEASLGDDVFGEDPTVNRLQEIAADRMGKEAAIFVASGTMGNLIAVLLHARPGQEVIADADAHVFMYEGAGAAALGGVQIRPLTTPRGLMDTAQVEDAIRPVDDAHQPVTAAVALEDTHNRHGGITWPLDELGLVAGVARKHRLTVHLDGARIFNAAVACDVDPAEIAGCADTVTFCISKGLGCPVGSLLCGPRELIGAAHRWRKMLGGGMRQAGVLAAAGIYALDNMVERLAEDHANARTLAEGLAEMDGVECDLERVQTNIVLIHVHAMPVSEFLEGCKARGLLGASMGGDSVRFVTHYGVGPADVQQALTAAYEALSG